MKLMKTLQPLTVQLISMRLLTKEELDHFILWFNKNQPEHKDYTINQVRYIEYSVYLKWANDYVTE